jgi:hypothetical protein
MISVRADLIGTEGRGPAPDRIEAEANGGCAVAGAMATVG